MFANSHVQGSILVAVNPYQHLGIYGLEVVRKYEGQLIGTLPPHIFGEGFGCNRSIRSCELQPSVPVPSGPCARATLISASSLAARAVSSDVFIHYSDLQRVQ